MRLPLPASVLFIGQSPDFDPMAGLSNRARKVWEAQEAEYDRLSHQMRTQGWRGDLCIIPLNDRGLPLVSRALRRWRYDCVVISTALCGSASDLTFVETIVNLVQIYAPDAAVAFVTSPQEAIAAAGRWIE